jgi:uncharacterized cupredoxin-like copper-binding protein
MKARFLVLTVLVAGVAPVAAMSAAFPATQDAAVAPQTTEVVPVKITIRAFDFGYRFSKLSVKRGTTVVFTVKNTGDLPHDISFKGYKKTPYIASGKTAKLKITFKKKGRVQYLCTVPRHAERGMAGAFVVK